MLVLSRKSGEEIVINDDIRLIIDRISGRRVKIAIAAPRHVRVMRGELEPPGRQRDSQPAHSTPL
jgi:carbon storage regulator CsrA